MAESAILDKLSGLKPKKKYKGIPLGQVLLDFTPASHIDEIKTRRAKKTWISFCILIFGVCIMAVLGVFSATLLTKGEVEASRIEKTQIQSQLGKYSEQDNAVSQNSTIVGKMTQAAGGEIDWGQLIREINQNLPSDTNITAMSVNLDPVSNERSVTVLSSLTSGTPTGYANTVRAMEDMAGVSNVNIGPLTGGAGYTYSMTFDFDTSVRTYRFSTPVEAAPATENSDSEIIEETEGE